MVGWADDADDGNLNAKVPRHSLWAEKIPPDLIFVEGSAGPEVTDQAALMRRHLAQAKVKK